MIVYGSSFSPFVRKTLAYISEKGLSAELIPANPAQPDPEFKKVSPFGKMPGFRDGDFGIADSTAIITYLEAKHPAPSLLPADPEARARTIWFEELADTILNPCMGKMFFNRFVAPRFFGRDGDEAIAAEAESKELPPILDYLEGAIPEGEYLVGGGLTVADLSVASAFINLDHIACGQIRRGTRRSSPTWRGSSRVPASRSMSPRRRRSSALEVDGT
ncbi:MAG TPA: glutathione S-transferase family protein [Caulobacteraceae bacterium]|nr:glutathione S-transferase family protein [Caulobacteraceae bacterium]